MIALVPAAAAPAAAAPAAPAHGARAAFSEVLRRHLAAPAPPTQAPGPAALAERALGGLDRARVKLDAALAQARAGRTFSAQELLALQADAYRLQQAVDVVSRAAEAGAQSVKQAVNTQV